MFSLPRAASDEDVARARAISRRLAAVEPGPLQTASAARELSREAPSPTARVIAVLVAMARSGGRKEGLVIESLGRALLNAPADGLTAAHRDAVMRSAEAQELPEVVALYIAPKPVLGMDEDQPFRPDPAIAHLSQGYKKMLARKASPDLLARLAAEGEPDVVRNILVNPRLSESQVVRICARRPIRPEVFREVWASRRWSSRELVRKAIVQNPYCEPELALKILPTLDERTLRLVARNQLVHASVRELAEHLRRKSEDTSAAE